jgi:hypothetical protein
MKDEGRGKKEEGRGKKEEGRIWDRTGLRNGFSREYFELVLSLGEVSNNLLVS